jgi:hypothetical protein
MYAIFICAAWATFLFFCIGLKVSFSHLSKRKKDTFGILVCGIYCFPLESPGQLPGYVGMQGIRLLFLFWTHKRFDFLDRNAWIEASDNSGTILKKAKKTGTTISGVVFKVENDIAFTMVFGSVLLFIVWKIFEIPVLCKSSLFRLLLFHRLIVRDRSMIVCD